MREKERTPTEILEAKENLRKMQETIAPFKKERNFEYHTTAGGWFESPEYESKHILSDRSKQTWL